MKIKFLLLGILFIPTLVFAVEDIRSSFRMIADFDVPQIALPTLVEVLIPKSFNKFGNHVGVYNINDNVFVPYDSSNKIYRDVPVRITSPDKPEQLLVNLIDGDYDTEVNFEIGDNQDHNEVIVSYTFDSPISTDTLEMQLSQYAFLPDKISIIADINTTYQYVLSEFSPETNIVNFPEISSNFFEVHLFYTQPIRFSEMKFVNKNNVGEDTKIQFIAYPGKKYQIYFDPEVVLSQSVGEKPNFDVADNHLELSLKDYRQNTLYKPADSDNDGVVDFKDNCISVANKDQIDLNFNNRGDSCEDFDLDGVISIEDNCPNHTNRDQNDIDRDGLGDACDTEESRITEKYPAIVWFAIGSATLIFVALFFIALKHRDVGEVVSVQKDNNQQPPSLV